MNRILLTALTFLIVHALWAQAGEENTKVLITVHAAEGTPVENATAELLRSRDSGLLKTALTDKKGQAEFNNIKPGSYLLRISSLNHTLYYTAPFTTASEPLVTLPVATLTAKAATQLQGVTVTARKPFIQKLSDRIVVNVENSIVSAGSTALDILERSPGITVDQNDAISLRGRAGVIIMIDGKPSPMNGADLANYLRSLPSNVIERIDIITNPSAKYDAAGNSGIIDIRLKKDQRLGTNGTATASYGQGIYPKANAGTTLNYRNKKVNVFGNYNLGYRQNYGNLIINRNFFNDGVFTGSDDKNNLGIGTGRSYNGRVGADFFPNKKTIVGFVVNQNNFKSDRRATINTVINDLSKNPASSFYSLATNDDKFRNTVANLNYKRTLDSQGRELTADVDYGVYDSRSITRTSSSFYDLNGNPKREDDILDGDQQGKLKLRTAKVDYVNPIGSGAKLEAGFKTSYVSSDNDARFFNVFSTGSVVDDAKTNRFLYKEYNNAGYVNFSKEFKKFNVQAGLRGEQTNISTRQVKGAKEFKNDYFALFPSAYFNYKLKEDQTLGVSVSRRIDRPGYSQLNPFLFQIDATIYSTGDPHLRPQMTWSYEGSYTVKNMNFTLGYSRTTAPQNTVISRILDVIPDFEIKPGQDSNITVQIPVNLEATDYFGLTATVPVRIAKWWNMINNANVYYNKFNGNLGGVQLNNGAPSANIRTNNNLTFTKGWSAELNGNFRSGGRYGYAIYKSQWSVDAGAQKNVFKGKGTVRLNVTDIFWTNLPRSTITYEGRYVENWHAYRETRVATLSFNYRFGNNKVAAARRRTTASEEERRRTGN